MIDNRYGCAWNVAFLVGNLAVRFWWAIVLLGFIGLLIICST